MSTSIQQCFYTVKLENLSGTFFAGENNGVGKMWYGKDTIELLELKKQYEELFGYNPDGEMELEYGQSSYNDYVDDLKEAIRTKKHLAEFVE